MSFFLSNSQSIKLIFNLKIDNNCNYIFNISKKDNQKKFWLCILFISLQTFNYRLLTIFIIKI